MTEKTRLTADQARKLSAASTYIDVVTDMVLATIEDVAAKGARSLNVALTYELMGYAYMGLQGRLMSVDMRDFGLKSPDGIKEVTEALTELGYSVTDHGSYKDLLIVEW